MILPDTCHVVVACDFDSMRSCVLFDFLLFLLHVLLFYLNYSRPYPDSFVSCFCIFYKFSVCLGFLIRSFHSARLVCIMRLSDVSVFDSVCYFLFLFVAATSALNSSS